MSEEDHSANGVDWNSIAAEALLKLSRIERLTMEQTAKLARFEDMDRHFSTIADNTYSIANEMQLARAERAGLIEIASGKRQVPMWLHILTLAAFGTIIIVLLVKVLNIDVEIEKDGLRAKPAIHTNP